jgi:dTMP kinase
VDKRQEIWYDNLSYYEKICGFEFPENTSRTPCKTGEEILLMGKLIVIEGTDGSGKSTQFRLLTQRVAAEGHQFQKLVFPQYQEESSALIRMYLGGEFGSKPSDVSSYAASAFFAVDRYASYKKVWGQWYEQGGLVLSDRYTTSNAVHQASKEEGEQQKEFLRWLYEFEYDKLGLPRPDLVIYLDVPTDFTEAMMRRREADTNTHADIHEQDLTYLATCRRTGKAAAQYYGWTVIQCVKDGSMRSIEDIHKEIYSHIKGCLEE